MMRHRTYYVKTSSSIKPEVHNVLQRYHRRTGPRPQATCTKDCRSLAMWFMRYVTGETDKHAHHNSYPSPWVK